MPDLNWRNPRLKAAMWGVMHSWLARGVDGFRVDVIYALVKDKEFRDDPLNPDYKQGDNPYEQLLHVYSLNRPEAHEVLREMRAVVDSYDGDRVLIGETFHLSSLAEIVSWYGANLDECHLPFNFKLITRPWDARQIRHLVEEYEQMLPIGAWPNWVLGNHDQHRIATRVGGIEQAKLAQMLLLTLRGTPTAYYGDEIGITNGLIPRESVRDPFEKRVQGQGRDPERTPMQWDSSLYAGFSDVEPWLPVAENYQAVNVEVETRDSTSILTLFRALTTLRRANDTLTIGSYSSVEVGHNEVFAYMRKHEETQVLVALNFGSEGQSLDLRGAGVACEVLLSTHLDRSGGEMLDGLYLRPNEGLVARL